MGQSHVVKTLKNALTTGRIAHAYLFSGPRGTGKTTVARILAKALNCAEGPAPEPCNRCHSCQSISQDRFLDVLEIDAASNRGISEMRDLCERARFAPAEGRYKVIIVDEVHMLTPEAFNAFLKTLEEPPPRVVFVLATTELHKVPGTIASRCQRFDFHRLSPEVIAERLREISKESGFSVDEEALQLMAEAAEGSVRDAISILDQAMNFAGGEKSITASDVLDLLGRTPKEVVAEILKAVMRRDPSRLLELVEAQEGAGRDLRLMARDIARGMRQEFLAAWGRHGCGDDDQAPLLRAMDHLLKAEAEMRWSSQPRLVLELALLKASLEFSRPAGDAVRGADQVTDTDRVGLPQRRAQEESAAAGAEGDAERRIVEAGQADAKAPDVRQLWPEFMARIRRRDPRAHALLLECSPAGVQGDVVVLDFRREFHKQGTEKQPYLGMVEEVLSGILGRSIKVKCRLAAPVQRAKGARASSVVTARGGRPSGGGADGAKPAPDPADPEHPLIKHVVDVFNGSLVE